MIGISTKQFAGEIPRVPAHELPANAAAYAMDCDFAYGDLRPMKSPLPCNYLAVSDAKSIYTEDGQKFYYWQYNAEAVKSPVINDTHKRLYFTVRDGADARFVSMTGTPPTNSGTCPSGYKLGVPSPAISWLDKKLTLKGLNYDASVQAENGWYCLGENIRLEFKFFYAEGGTKYQETELPIVRAAPWPSYFASPQPCPKYSDGTGGNIPIFGRDFQCKVPKRILRVTKKVVSEQPIGGLTVMGIWDPNRMVQVTQDVESTGTPDTAVPVVQIDAYSGTTFLFTVYSDGSDFASGNICSSRTGSVKLLTPWMNDGNTNGNDDCIIVAALKYGVVDSRAYVYTYVNEFGEEGMPSEPETIDLEWGCTVEASVSFNQMGSLGWDDYAPINRIRLYATNTNSQGNTDYYFDEEKLISTSALPSSVRDFSVSFNLTNKPEQYGEQISSTNYNLPPEGCTGFVALPNGIIAAHVDTAEAGGNAGENVLYFCEPYHPHAYPLKYAMTFPWDIVGIRPMGNGLLVTTKGMPFYVYGVHPEGMSQTKINVTQAGISKHAMVDMGNSVVYASNDGFVMVDGASASLEVSQQLFTREKWRDMYGASLQYLRLAYHDGCLIGYFTTGTPGFVIRFDEAAGSLTRWSQMGFNCHFISPMADKLFFVKANALHSFAEGGYATATWKTKEVITPYPMNFSVLQVTPDGYAAGTATVYADGVITTTISFAGNKPMAFRLNAGFRASAWQVQIGTTGIIKELALATSIKELKSV